MKSSLSFDRIDVDFSDFRNIFAEVSFIDVFHIGPIIFYCDLFEFGFVLIMPRSEVSSLFFCEGSCAGDIVFSSISHFNVFRDEISVGDSGISFYDSKFLIFFAGGYDWEVTAFELAFVEAVKKGEWDVFVFLTFEFPIDPFFIL